MAENTKTPCECSFFEAQDPEQLTEENLESGNYETFDTGCQSETGRVFAPGHDARLKSHLIRWGALGLEVARNPGGVRSVADAQHWADKYGFGHMVSAGIDKAVEKAKAKADREAARAAKKAEGKKSKAAKVADSGNLEHDGNSARREREAKSLADIVAAEEAAHAEAEKRSRPEPEWDDEPAKPVNLTDEPEVQAKVGRWTYKGIEKDGVFYYLAKDGHTRKETTKYQVV